LLATTVLVALGCGLERDGSHATSADTAPATSGEGAFHDRYRTEVVRLGVSRPLFMLIDTATGRVETRTVLGNQMFRPLAAPPPPGAELEPRLPGRYDVKVVPGRRGSALLRLDTVTGKTWFFQLGASQKNWRVLDRLTEEEAATESEAPAGAPSPGQPRQEGATGSTDAPPPATQAMADSGDGRSENELEGLREVLGDSSYDIQLRIWTAKHMAELYPVEAAEMASAQLSSDDPRILVAIADTAQLDPDGRVRTAFEGLAGHQDKKVAAAIAARIGGATQP
jgi:hypothetical protein